MKLYSVLFLGQCYLGDGYYGLIEANPLIGLYSTYESAENAIIDNILENSPNRNRKDYKIISCYIDNINDDNI